MLTAALAAILLQQAPLAGRVVWETPVATDPAVEADATPRRSIAASLPAWALADPFAWERSQCSPLIRHEPNMEDCQLRVRAQLAAELGPSLPPGLDPAAVPRSCVPTETGSGGFEVSCKPPERVAAAPLAPREQICDSRPQRASGGGVSFASTCRPLGEDTAGGLAVRLGDDGLRFGRGD